MGDELIRVAIVDDHTLFADGLATALGGLPDIAVIRTYANGTEFLREAPRSEIDVLLLDLEMPGESGIDVLRFLQGKLPTIVVSMHSGADEQAEAVQEGARGFLPKSAPLADLAAAVRAVHDGRNLIQSTTTLSEVLDQYREANLDPGAAALTRRERELLAMMARGITATDELAELLFISQKTVKNHLASIYQKLAVSDRAQAAVEAIRLGLGPE